MVVRDYREIEAKDVAEPGAEDVRIRQVITRREGAPHFTMRVFDVAPGGYTPFHTHEWEHEVFVLEGEGVVVSEQGEHALTSGTTVFVPGGETHNFRNTGPDVLRFICLIPNPE